MTDAQARALALRITMFYADFDPFGYSDTLKDFDDNEELLLENSAKEIKEHPEVVIDHLLETMEANLIM